MRPALAAASVLAVVLTLAPPPVPPPSPPSDPPSSRPVPGPLRDVAPSVAVLPGTALQDATVMQSVGFDTTNRVWVFSQVMAGGRFGQSYSTHKANGDLTLTKVSATGQVLGHMYLLGFSHGGSIGAQGVGGATYVWLGAGHLPASADPVGIETGAGIMTVKVPWRDSATVRLADPVVEKFADNPGQPFQAPALNVDADLIAVRYYSRTLKVIRMAVYRLSDFARHQYVALRRFTVPREAFAPNLQAWAPIPDRVLAFTGSPYGPDNPPPGNLALVAIDAATGVAVSRQPILAGAELEHREPEGLAALALNRCVAFAIGPAGARRASVYCQRPV